MNNGWHGKPLTVKQQVRLMIALTILAWATQTLFHQWSFGQEFSKEKFVAADPRSARSATLELRTEATIYGTDVKLKQICRWSDADATGMAPLADLVVARFGKKSSPYMAVTTTEIKDVLRGAGVNIAIIQFAGATSCTVDRGDVQVDERTALQQWIDARESGTSEAQDAEETADKTPNQPLPAVELSAAPMIQQTVAKVDDILEEQKPRSLRELLTDDLAHRLAVAPEQLQFSFNPQDERLLNLSEPLFRFNLEARRARNLGTVSWDVLIVTDTGTQKATITAAARAWQEQVVVAKPLAMKQVVQADDVIKRRTLVDRMLDDALLTQEQVVGQQAARDLKPGTVMTSRLVDPVQLVKPGQFVTITLARGNVQLSSVARALEGGSYGQTIKVKNEATRDVFEAVLTGPQTASVGPTTQSQAGPQTALR